MILANQIICYKKVCKANILNELIKIYKENKLSYLITKYSDVKKIKSLIPYLKNDKKNDDEKN